jgi:serine/threonine-protein kinase
VKRDTQGDRPTLPRDPAAPHDTIRTVRFQAQSLPKPIDEPELDGPLSNASAVEDRYRSTDLLGQGGMGEVRCAFDVKIGREIAIKTMLALPEGEVRVAASRFLREARVQALLEHPAIVPVYDIGSDARGLPFFTMKRVRGETLHDVIGSAIKSLRTTQGQRGRHRMLSAFLTVCMALDYAHQRGVVHRDLKPENIMLGPHGEVYILDWGVAKIGNQAGAAANELDFGDSGTRPGEMVGTPGFMPPEQVLGQHDEVDARSDVYALGALLYEILTCKPLHDGQDVMHVLESTMSASRVDPPAPPDVPPELYALALRATRFHKDDRPKTAREVADAVERYLDGDRDEELRKRLADGRAREAQQLAEEALSGPLEQRDAARARAMQEAGGALALAPKHTAAASVVLRLLASPPAEDPREVDGELAALERGHSKGVLKDNAIRIGSWILLAPLPILMGLRIPWVGALAVALLGVGSMLAAGAWRFGFAGRAYRLGLFGLTSLLAVIMTSIFGPLVFIPGFAAMNTILFSVQAARWERALMITGGIASFLVPLSLELLGWVPASMTFEAGGLLIHPRMTEFPPTLTIVFLTLVSIAGIVTPALLTGRLRDALRMAERSLVVQKWQLSQLSPHAVTSRQP